MRLGKRSARIRSVDGRQLIAMRLWLLLAGCTLIAPANAQTASTQSTPTQAAPAQAATVGPGRIICNAAFCQMGSGARPKERFRVIVSDLPNEEIHRLRKCTGVAKPCIVTIEGLEQGGPMRIMATTIHWED
jgi:hypothetical protein